MEHFKMRAVKFARDSSGSSRFVASLTYWFTESLVHWFIDSIDSMIHRFTGSLNWFIGSFVHSFIESSIHWFIRSFGQLHAQSFMTFSGISNTIRSFADAPQFQQFIASASFLRFPILDDWFLIAISFFRNFRPSACWALPGSTIR